MYWVVWLWIVGIASVGTESVGIVSASRIVKCCYCHIFFCKWRNASVLPLVLGPPCTFVVKSSWKIVCSTTILPSRCYLSVNNTLGQFLAVYKWCIGTVENHGNTEITETVIFVKCRDFAKIPCLPCFLAKMPCFYIFTIISSSLLCDFNTNTKMFDLCLCYQSPCALLPWRHRRNVYFTFFWS